MPNYPVWILVYKSHDSNFFACTQKISYYEVPTALPRGTATLNNTVSNDFLEFTGQYSLDCIYISSPKINALKGLVKRRQNIRVRMRPPQVLARIHRHPSSSAKPLHVRI